MKSKKVLDRILYNSIPHLLPDSDEGWYEYRIKLVECTLYIEAWSNESDEREIPRHKVRKMKVVNDA